MKYRLLSLVNGTVERQTILNKITGIGILVAFVFANFGHAAVVNSSDDSGLLLNPVITVIEQGFNSLTQTSAVGLTSVGFTAARAVQVGQSLSNGDLLSSKGGIRLQIRCSAESKISLSGTFVAQVLASGSNECAFNISQGSLTTETRGNVVVRSGSSTLTTDHSIVGIHVNGAGLTGSTRWQVSQGDAELQLLGVTYKLGQGGKITLSSDAVVESQVMTVADHAKTANILARLEAIYKRTGADSSTEIANKYVASRNEYLRRFNGSVNTSVASVGKNDIDLAIGEQQLGLETLADVDDLLSVRGDGELNTSGNIRRETWSLQDQGVPIGTTVATQVQLPQSVGVIPPGAITRDF